MIKFNNFPPEKAGDVEFTPAALHQLTQYGSMLPGNENARTNRAMIHAFGQSVGHTLVHAIEGSTDQKVYEVAQPLFDEAKANMTASSHEFTAGVLYAVDIARQVEGAIA